MRITIACLVMFLSFPFVAHLQEPPAEDSSAEMVSDVPVEPAGEVAGVSDLLPEYVGKTASANATFRYQRLNWNTFVFETVTPSIPGTRYEWTFGDGVTSNRRRVEHAFRGSGEFFVALRVIASDESVSEDGATVFVPFFTFENRLVTALTGLLSVLLLVGLVTTLRMGSYARRYNKENAASRVPIRKD